MILNINFGYIPLLGSRDRVELNLGENLTLKSATVTLKIWSRSPTPHQVFALSKQCNVQVWPKSTHWFRRYGTEKADFHSLYWLVTLKIRSRSLKSNQLYCVTMVLYINFGQNPSFGSRDIVRKQNFGQNLIF